MVDSIFDEIKSASFKFLFINRVEMTHGAKAWLADFKHPHYQAARNAIKKGRSWLLDLFFLMSSTCYHKSFLNFKVWNVEPDFTREGGSIPVTLTFQELTGKNVLLLPVGSSDDGAHSQNEKINISNYIQGVNGIIITLTKLAFKYLLITKYFFLSRSNSWELTSKRLLS